MKKQLLKNITIVVFAGACAVGLSLVHADWHEPLNAPASSIATPASSVDLIGVPVNSGSVSQIKDEGLSVEGFVSAGNAEFDQQVFAADLIRGCGPNPDPTDPECTDVTNTTVHFGGAVSGNSARVNVESTGSMYVKNNIQSSMLSNPSLMPVCAGTDGTVSLCQ